MPEESPTDLPAADAADGPEAPEAPESSRTATGHPDGGADEADEAGRDHVLAEPEGRSAPAEHPEPSTDEDRALLERLTAEFDEIERELAAIDAPEEGRLL